MRLLFYSSPYEYYADNLRPLVRKAMEAGDDVFGSYSLELTDKLDKIKEIPYTNESQTPMADFLNGKIKVDAVVITQPWWYADKMIAEKAKSKKIPFYIVDHAPPMFRYTEANGKKSHQYRRNLNGTKAFFAYGKETISIMKGVGCRDKMVAMGSPRIEDMISRVEAYEKEENIVIFDTSHRMEDKNVAKMTAKLAEDLAGRHNKKIYLREHSRSPKMVRKALSNFKLVNDWDEAEVSARSGIFLFTLPSSAMLLPASLDKHIIGTYGNHFSAAAKVYSHRHREDIFIFKGKMNGVEKYIKSYPSYGKFLSNNLKRYNERNSASNAILSYIRSGR